MGRSINAHWSTNTIICRLKASHICIKKLTKGKALRKHSLHEKTAASVLLKLFIYHIPKSLTLIYITVYSSLVHAMFMSCHQHSVILLTMYSRGDLVRSTFILCFFGIMFRYKDITAFFRRRHFSKYPMGESLSKL